MALLLRLVGEESWAADWTLCTGWDPFVEFRVHPPQNHDGKNPEVIC